MSIVCGTDFSEPAQRAVRVAMQLARRANAPLHLVHALQLSADLDEAPKTEVVLWAERQLERKAAFARELGVATTTHLTTGTPDEALIKRAAECQAELIVVGALGQRARGTWQLGSHADRLAQRAHVPVLVVRNSEPFETWLENKRALRVVLGADLSRSTDVAMAQVARLRALSPCDVTAVHLYWPPQQFERLGLGGVRNLLERDPEVTKTLVRDLTHRLAPTDSAESLDICVEPHLGRRGDRLAAIATERGADLLVVGSHDRSALGSIWEGSVARWALHAAEISVLCVPLPTAAASAVSVPRLRNVFAATDFSPAGNAAIAMAYALTEAGGTLHVAHVVPARDNRTLEPHDVFALEQAKDPRRIETHAALTALIPRDSQCVTRLYALESNEPASAICQAALRVDADIICLGHRRRSKLAHTLLGSIASDVLAHAERPVVLAPPPQD
jgi:nucleotide-binding universal stress UspA family protein